MNSGSYSESEYVPSSDDQSIKYFEATSKVADPLDLNLMCIRDMEAWRRKIPNVEEMENPQYDVQLVLQ
jgi:hypothetical protein